MSLTIGTLTLNETVEPGSFTTPSGAVVDVKSEITKLKNGGIRLFVGISAPWSEGEGDDVASGRETAQLVVIGTPQSVAANETARQVARDAIHAALAAIAFQLSDGDLKIADRADRLLPALQDGDVVPAVEVPAE